VHAGSAADGRDGIASTSRPAAEFAPANVVLVDEINRDAETQSALRGQWPNAR
jgi:hypothetical protein